MVASDRARILWLSVSFHASFIDDRVIAYSRDYCGLYKYVRWLVCMV